MKMTILPRDRSGAWAAILCITFIALIYYKVTHYSIPLPVMIIALLGLCGFFLAIYAVVVKENRALLTFAAIPVGVLILVWLVGEWIFQHW